MKRERSTLIFGYALLSLSFLASCSADEGEACQLDDDCASGLVCCRGSGSVRGFCGQEGERLCGGGPGSTDDAGTSATSDAGHDDAGSDDSGVSDSGMIDSGAIDSGVDAAMSIMDAGDSDDGG